ncbi:hypothetical protein K2Q02_00490, partial [Patescibacteria group bacterium]|nr:hypothetical protein [Patescibacteria group bacterium]
MASFFSFFIHKRIPSLRTLRALLRGPLTLSRAVVYGLFSVIILLAFLLLITIHNSFLITVPARGGSLTEGIIGAPQAINPIIATTDTDKSLSRLVYAGLLKTMPDGSVEPELAQDYSVSPDSRTYTFTLKESKFQDGKKVTSADVAFTISKLQNYSLNPIQAEYWSEIVVQTPDEQTIIISLPNARTDFLQKATVGILPEHIWRDISDEDFLTTKKNIKSVGAGPFVVTSAS